MFDRTQVIQEKIFFDSIFFFLFTCKMVFFFLSLGCFILQLMLIFSLFSFFVFSFNICLIHKEKHAFFHFFHSVFVFFQVCWFIFFFWFLDIRVEGKGRFFCITWVLMGGFFVLLFFFSILSFSFLHMFAFLWFKMNWIVHLIWASGSFFFISTIFVNGQEKEKKGILEAAQQRLDSALPKNVFWVGFCHHC